MGAALSESLRRQVPGGILRSPLCWYEDQGAQLLLIAGEVCTGFDEIRFQMANLTWELVNVERNDLVICDERKRN